MAETTVVHLLRHGEVHNPDGVLYGRLAGYHLSANGRMMAAAAADYFDGRPVAAIFASPLERAQETAAPVAERLGLEGSGAMDVYVTVRAAPALEDFTANLRAPILVRDGQAWQVINQAPGCEFKFHACRSRFAASSSARRLPASPASRRLGSSPP